MDVLILFGVGFVGLMMIIVGFFVIAARKVSGPAKELEKKVTRLEEQLDRLKNK